MSDSLWPKKAAYGGWKTSSKIHESSYFASLCIKKEQLFFFCNYAPVLLSKSGWIRDFLWNGTLMWLHFLFSSSSLLHYWFLLRIFLNNSFILNYWLRIQLWKKPTWYTLNHVTHTHTHTHTFEGDHRSKCIPI